MQRFLLFILNIFSKQRRANFLKYSQVISESIGIILFIFVVLISFIEFGYAIKHLISTADQHSFIKEILSSFELLFIAPIPLLVIFSFKRFIIKMFPLQVIMSLEEKDHLLDEIVAKKTFISSIIGVVSTFLLGSFIEQFSQHKTISGEDNLLSSNKKIVDVISIQSHPYLIVTMFILMLLFLLILIYYYNQLLSHKSKEEASAGNIV